MSTPRGAMRWLVIAPLALLLLYVSAMLGLYAYGLHLAPDDLSPARTQAPAHIHALWKRVEVPGARRLPGLDPVTLFPRWYLQAKERMAKRGDARDLQRRLDNLHGAVVRRVMYRQRDVMSYRGGKWHLAGAAVRIHISRHWSLDDAINTHLVESEYGRGAIGIDAAAQAYFGVPAAALREDEALALLVIEWSPSMYTLDCGKPRERFDRRFAALASRAGNDGASWTPDAALARLRPATCAQRGNRAAQAMDAAGAAASSANTGNSGVPQAGIRKKP